MRCLFIIFFLIALFSCASKGANVKFYDGKTEASDYVEPEKLHGFRYTVPEDMEEYVNPRRFRLRNLLVYKGCSYLESPMIIAIRETRDFSNYSTQSFAKRDQNLLRSSRQITYEKSYWTPTGFEEKNIDYTSFQFTYFSGAVKIYQRSVYIKCDDAFYIVSMTSKDKLLVIHKNNESFWNSIHVD